MRIQVRNAAVAVLIGISLAASPVDATVINFDDLDGTGGPPIPSNYQGFNWSSDFAVYDNAEYINIYVNTVVFPSAPNAAFNGYGDVTVSLSSGAAFDFNGAYFTGWAKNDAAVLFTSPSITVNGYNGVTLVGTATMALPTASFAWLNANLDGVTSLEFNNGGTAGQWWLMDNFTYNATPDGGSTLSLLGVCMAGLVALRRKIVRA